MKLLIVDDIVKNIQLIAAVLHEYDTTFATSGEEALEMLPHDEFDLIMLDVMMPGVDGFQTCQKIKKMPKYKDIPIIFLTADNNVESVSRGFEVGGVDYVTKPFHSRELLSRVKNQLFIREKNKEKELILLQQFKMAQMGEAFSMITHQLKQPLSAINATGIDLNMAVELGTLDDAKVLNSVENIDRYVHSLSETIDEYKSFFKPKNSFDNATILDLLKKVNLLTSQMLKSQAVVLIVNVENEKEFFKTLVNEVAQVLLVLFQNSIDASSAKMIDGIIQLNIKKRDNGIYISVEDNAGGINDTIKDNIFDLNFTTKGVDGSGIGLYMVKNIITQHLSGTIECENINSGTLFKIFLPNLLV